MVAVYVTVRVRSVAWFTAGALLAAAVTVMFVTAWRADAAPTPVEATIVAIEPVRVLDTRDPNDIGLAGPFVSPVSQKLRVTGPIQTATGTQTVVPVGATGVLLSFTIVGPTADGFASVRPGDAVGAPTTSSINFSAGSSVANSVQVALPTTGSNAGMIDITYDALGVAGPTTEVLVDVVGYTTTGKLDELATQVAAKADLSDVYSRSEVDAKVAAKADVSDVYSRSEVDAKDAAKADDSDVYTRSEVDAKDAAKADAADVYTKAEIDASNANALFAMGTSDADGNPVTAAPAFGNYTLSRTGTGQYSILFPGVNAGSPCTTSLPHVQLTPWNSVVAMRIVAYSAGCPAGDVLVVVDAYDVTGGATDGDITDTLFHFAAYRKPGVPIGPVQRPAGIDGPFVCEWGPGDVEPVCTPDDG